MKDEEKDISMDSSQGGIMTSVEVHSPLCNTPVEISEALWNIILGFCDNSTIANIRCSSRLLNDVFLNRLQNDVGEKNVNYEVPSIVPCLTAQLACRESFVGTTGTVEEGLSRSADAAKDMEMDLLGNSPFCVEAKKMTTGDILDCCQNANSSDLEDLHHLRQCNFCSQAHEWLSNLSDARRSCFNIRHGLFNNYSIRSETRCFLLPDGTLCTTSADTIMLFSRWSRGCLCFCNGADYSLERRQFDDTWSLEEVLQLPEAITTVYYDRYSRSVVVGSEAGTLLVRIVTPAMDASELRVNPFSRKEESRTFHIEERQKGDDRVEEVHDSVLLPSYRWSAGSITASVDCINNFLDSIAASNNSTSNSREDKKKNRISVVYDNEDVTSDILPGVIAAQGNYAEVSALYDVATEEILSDISIADEDEPTESIAESMCATQSETPVVNHFTFTSFPPTTLLLAQAFSTAQLFISQVGLTRVADLNFSVSEMMLLSISPFVATYNTSAEEKDRGCKDAVYNLSKLSSCALPSEFSSLRSDFRDVEECEIIIAGGVHYPFISRVRLRRCLVEKIGFSSSSKEGMTTQNWYLLRGYWYYVVNEAEMEGQSQCLFTFVVAPRLWLPQLQERLLNGASEGELSRGSNRVQWRPRYDGHYYFNKPFFLTTKSASLQVTALHSVPDTEDDAESTAKELTVQFSELLLPEEDPSSIPMHGQRYQQLFENVSSCAVSPTNAFFVFTTITGQILLAAPPLSTQVTDTDINHLPHSTSEADHPAPSAHSSARESDSEPSSPASVAKSVSSFIGFGGAEVTVSVPRHYRTTSIPSTDEDREEEGIEQSSSSGRVDPESVFGTRFRLDPVLQFIQGTYPSVIDVWSRQCDTTEADTTAPSLASILRLPLFVCFLKVEQDVAGAPSVIEVHLDDWKLTTLNAALDVVVYDMSSVYPTSRSGAKPLNSYPAIRPLYSMGLFSKPCRPLLSKSKIEKLLTTMLLSASIRIRPMLEWQDGVMIVNTPFASIRNAFLVDSYPTFCIPSVLRDESNSVYSMCKQNGISADSASRASALKQWRDTRERDMAECVRQVEADIREFRNHCERETEDDEIAVDDFYLLDLVGFCGECEPMGYALFSDYINDSRFDGTIASPVSTLHPPHFGCFHTELLKVLLCTVLIPFCILFFAVYVMLNAANLSGTKLVPYVAILPFSFPLLFLLWLVNEREEVHIPFQAAVHCIRVIRIPILFGVYFLLFALKHDDYLPDGMTWLSISMVVVGATALLLVEGTITFFQDGKLSSDYLSICLLPPSTITIILLSIYFDSPSSSNPATGKFPLAVAFIPLFLVFAVFFFFVAVEEFWNETIAHKVFFVFRFALHFMVSVFPLILFILKFGKYWEWVEHPERTKQPSCIISAVLLCLPLIFTVLMTTKSCIETLLIICSR